MTPRHIQGTSSLNNKSWKHYESQISCFVYFQSECNFEACVNQEVILQLTVMKNSKKYRSLLTECNKILLQSKWRGLLIRLFNDAVNIEVC